MKNKKYLKSLKALLLSVAITFSGCIPVSLPTNNAIVAEAAEKIRLNKTNLTLRVSSFHDETYQLKITGTNKKAKWSINNKNVAAVSQKGRVTAKHAGKAVITAKVGGKELKCRLTVKKVSIIYDDSFNDQIDTDNDFNNTYDDIISNENSAYDKLYQAVMNSSLINADGNHFIEYPYNDLTFKIIYNNYDNQFEFIGADNDTGTSTTIFINRQGSEKALIDFSYTADDADINCHGTAYLTLHSYTENTILDFAFDTGNYLFADSYQKLANTDVILCLLGCQKLLQKNTDLSLYDLGFLRFQNTK